MCNYPEQLESRMAVLDRYLQTMVRGRSRMRKGDSFITFSDTPPDELTSPSLAAARQCELVAVEQRSLAADSPAPGDTILRPAPTTPVPAGSSGSRGHSRYVQFVFMKRTFFIDLPNETLFPAEAGRLLRQRSGFFYLHQRRWWFDTYEHWLDEVKNFDPVQKEYLNADTRAAAQDMAFILYTLWRFPLEWPLYYRANRFEFGRPGDWEGVGRVGPS